VLDEDETGASGGVDSSILICLSSCRRLWWWTVVRVVTVRGPPCLTPAFSYILNILLVICD